MSRADRAIRAGSVLFGVGCVLWAATPLGSAGLGHADLRYLALFVAGVGVAGGALRLAVTGVPVPEDSYLLTGAARAWLRSVEVIRLTPWEEGAVAAALWLEVLHPARPWHTAVLGAALIAYLLATHLAESGARPRVLRPQGRVLAVGAVLLALGAAAGMVPPVGLEAGSALLRLAAAAALIAAAGLVLPYVAREAVMSREAVVSREAGISRGAGSGPGPRPPGGGR